MEKVKFISLLNEATFKNIWEYGFQYSKEYLYRIIGTIVDYKVDKFRLVERTIGDYELSGILLLSPDNLKKIYIEFNNYYKNDKDDDKDYYLYKTIDEIYSSNQDEYMKDVQIDYIKFNNFCNYNRKLIYKEKLEDNINVYNINIPLLKECYVDDLFCKDLSMFKTSSYEEMKEFIEGDILRDSVYRYLLELGENEYFCSKYEYADYIEELLHMERDVGFRNGSISNT